MILLSLPVAASQGADAFDPLSIDMPGFLTTEGRVSETAPAPGAIAFPATDPGGAARPLRFSFDAPVRFIPGGGFDVALKLQIDQPFVGRDPAGDSFELAIEPGGDPVRVGLDSPIVAPGTLASVDVKLQAPGALYAEGDAITLRITPLTPVTQGAMSLVVGPDASRLDTLDMRIPSIADLGLQVSPLAEFVLANESFEPPSGHAVNTVRVHHDRIDAPTTGAFSNQATYVVLRGEETGDDARAHAHPDNTRRIQAAHEITVNGIVTRVHPGLGVIVRINQPTITIECARNCPPGGYRTTLAPPSTTPTAEPPSVLVPPPPATTGIPVSKDDPTPRDTPLPAAIAAIALLAAASRRKR